MRFLLKSHTHLYNFVCANDVNFFSGQPIEVTDLENGGLCDVRELDCDRVRVFGLGFIDSTDLACLVIKLKVRRLNKRAIIVFLN